MIQMNAIELMTLMILCGVAGVCLGIIYEAGRPKT